LEEGYPFVQVMPFLTTIKSSTRKKRIGLINADQKNNEIALESCFKTFPFFDP